MTAPARARLITCLLCAAFFVGSALAQTTPAKGSTLRRAVLDGLRTKIASNKNLVFNVYEMRVLDKYAYIMVEPTRPDWVKQAYYHVEPLGFLMERDKSKKWAPKYQIYTPHEGSSAGNAQVFDYRLLRDSKIPVRKLTKAFDPMAKKGWLYMVGFTDEGMEEHTVPLEVLKSKAKTYKGFRLEYVRVVRKL